MSQTPAQRKAAERQRQKDHGRVAVQVWIDPADRVKLAHYIKRLNERTTRPFRATDGGFPHTTLDRKHDEKRD